MDLIGKGLAFIGLWQVIALLIAALPLLAHMYTTDTTDMDTDDVLSEMNFLAKWIESWMTGMVQLPSLILSIVFNLLYAIKYGSSSSSSSW